MKKYRVKIGKLYFLRWVKNQYPLFIIDDTPGFKKEAPSFPKEEAEYIIRELQAGIAEVAE